MEINIYKRMALATAELRVVAKNLNVETGNGKSYKAVSERDILDTVKPIEEKYGIYSYPVSRKVLESQTYETESKYGTKTTFMTRIETTYRFVNVDKPEEYIETTTFAEGIDSQDKGSGKAMTYGDKYALMKAYKISTGDDPDQEASKDEHYFTKPVKAEKETSKGDIGYLCVDCEVPLVSSTINGKTLSAAQLAAYTQKKYGKVLCPECAARAKWVMANESNEGNASV